MVKKVKKAWRWALQRWYARLRDIDRSILWPSCKREAALQHPEDPMNWAKAAFAVHAFHDDAWLVLGDDLEAAIEELT